MLETFKKGILTGLGLIVVTAEELEKKVNQLVEKGKLSTEEGESIVREFMQKSEDQQKDFQDWILNTIKSGRERLDLAGKEELHDQEARISSLEDRVSTLESLQMKESKKDSP